MASLAGFSLFLAFFVACVGLIASADACVRRHRASYRILRRSLYVLPLLLGIACAILVTGFVQSWMNFEYVASNSSRDLALLYRITGLWSGQSGSLLFWAFVLSSYGFFITLQSRDREPGLFYGSTLGTLCGLQVFFLFLLNWITYPFTRLWNVDGAIRAAAAAPPGASPASVQGAGLNPVLQHPGMAIHPPMLYLGYIGLAVPFCFAVGALISGRLNTEWIRQSRVWTMFSWTILSFGIVLGGWWAYQELGWGGYWAWDPVENASFMPWLMSTAFVHSVMIQKRRNMMRRWNIILVSLAFLLSIFGTFLTRSGLLNSVHTFAEDPVIGTSFMVFISVLFLGVVGLVLYRYSELESENQLESILSREFMFLLNNMVLVGICFAVLWGTVYPIISEYLTGERISVGPAFYNQVTLPMFLVLLLLAGIGPLISWRKASLSNLVRNFTLPLGVGLGTAGVLVGLGFYRWLPLLSFSICAFVLTTILMEFHRGARARSRSTGEPYPLAMVRLTWKARPRFGGYIVHFGVLMIVVGITASSAYKATEEATLKPGESVSLRGYTLTHQSMDWHVIGRDRERPDPSAGQACGQQINCRINARIRVERNGRDLTTLTPGQELLTTSRNPRARVDIRSTLRDDLYLVLSAWTDQGAASLHVYHNPLVNLIWLGVLVLLFGGLYAFVPLGS